MPYTHLTSGNQNPAYGYIYFKILKYYVILVKPFLARVQKLKRIAIPKEVVELYKIKEGDYLEVTVIKMDITKVK